jgi:hypothetical protein
MELVYKGYYKCVNCNLLIKKENITKEDYTIELDLEKIRNWILDKELKFRDWVFNGGKGKRRLILLLQYYGLKDKYLYDKGLILKIYNNIIWDKNMNDLLFFLNF